MDDVFKNFSFLGDKLINEIRNDAIIKEIPAGTEILREGQYVKVVPIVAKGLIKVFTKFNLKDLLLYYIEPHQSCVMSFAAGLQDQPSRVYAITEEDTTALLLPVYRVTSWVHQYPNINELFYAQYNIRYSELLDTINHLIFSNLDTRLFDYLKEKSRVTGKNPLKISHRTIANELGTSREVISRVIKKLEREGKVVQHTDRVEILEAGDLSH